MMLVSYHIAPRREGRKIYPLATFSTYSYTLKQLNDMQCLRDRLKGYDQTVHPPVHLSMSAAWTLNFLAGVVGGCFACFMQSVTASFSPCSLARILQCQERRRRITRRVGVGGLTKWPAKKGGRGLKFRGCDFGAGKFLLSEIISKNSFEDL